MDDAAFSPATMLCGAFYAEAVRPLLVGHPHAAALLGWGSDVLGYDTGRSTDHGWGLRLLVFVDVADDHEKLTAMLDSRLPERFYGRPVRFGWDAMPVRHHVQVTSLHSWLVDYLGVDPRAGWTVPASVDTGLESRLSCRE